jgi:hypothetical protein
MKKLMRILILSMLSVFLVAGSAMAFPYTEVEGNVNPYAATITYNGDGTSTLTGLQYTFTVTDSMLNAEMDFLSLEFENDVFTSVSSLNFVNPPDWTPLLDFSTFGSLYKISSGGTTIGVGESLQFTVDVVMNNAAFTDSSLWQEGQIWGQSWLSGDTLRGGDGGSTSSPVPEPSTVMLVGTGLLGMIAFGRKRFNKKA